MKQILRMFAVVGIVLLTASITALSCNKDDKSNNNNNNNSGGNGNKVTLDPNIVVTKVNDVSTVSTDGVIKILATKFPTTVAAAATDNMGKVITNATDTTRIQAFSVKFKEATGGMMFAVRGDKTDINTLTTPIVYTGGSIENGAATNDGIHMVVENSPAAGTLIKGINIIGVFAKKTAPTDIDSAAADKAPFAFTASTTTGKGTQPVLWCVATLTTVTEDATTMKLTGGQEAKCYVASVGASALGTATTATDWLGQTGNFKKAIKVSFAGIRTDDKTLNKIGLPSGNELDTFATGISAAQMAGMVGALGEGKSALSTYTIEIVSAL